jgi:hypothetical protein
LAVLLALPAAASAQVGAIGVVPGSAATGADAYIGTPILVNSSLTLPRGRWSVSGYGVFSKFSVDEFDFEESDRTLFATAAYAPTDRAMFGVQLLPYASYDIESSLGEASESGMGDAVLFGKYQFWRSASGRTSMAGVGSASLPIGSDEFGGEGISLGAGAILSHRSNRVTWHVESGVGIPTDDADGETAFSLNGAAVIAASQRMWLSLEALNTFSDGEHQLLFAPGARFAVGGRAFLDGALAFEVANSVDESAFDYALLLGLVIVP